MRATCIRLCNLRTVLFISLCCFLGSVGEAKSQLWEVPPLPPVTAAQAPDGMTGTVGKESLHISDSSTVHCLPFIIAGGPSRG